MTGFKWFAPVAVVALIVAIIVGVGSYHMTTTVGANLRAAGIHLQAMHAWAPAPAKSAG